LRLIQKLRIPLEYGGGVRDYATIVSLMELGVQEVILGTMAFENPSGLAQAVREYPGRIIVGIDAKDGYVATHGWTQITETRASDFARVVADLGIPTIIYTDIARDGTLTGPNLEGLRMLSQTVNVNIIASGGIGSLKDIQDIKNLNQSQIVGIILGQSLYSGVIRFKEALDMMQQGKSH